MIHSLLCVYVREMVCGDFMCVSSDMWYSVWRVREHEPGSPSRRRAIEGHYHVPHMNESRTIKLTYKCVTNYPNGM